MSFVLDNPPAPIHSEYARLVFYDDFTSERTIDMADARTPGFKWFRRQWWQNGVTDANNIRVSGSVLKLGGGTGRARLQSAIENDTGSGYTGNTWRDGAYIEIRMKFDPQLRASSKENFGIYLFSVEALYGKPEAPPSAQWPGQPTGYSHFVEVDLFEPAGLNAAHNYVGKTSYQATIHDWSGTYDRIKGWQHNISNSNSLISTGPVDWSRFHTYGWLWVPQNGSTAGYCKWFFDGREVATVYWRGPPASPPLPGKGRPYTATSIDARIPGIATETFSILDRQGLAMQLDGNSSWPIFIDWVKVWQR